MTAYMFSDDAIRAQDWFEADEMVHVTPRHLAGDDHGIETVFAQLVATHGWYTHPGSDEFTPFASPCERMRLGFLNEYDDPWQFTAAEDPYGPPSWRMAFSWQTPPELVAIALDEANALLRRPADDGYAFTRGGSAMRALFALARHGWTENTESVGAYALTSPDGYVTVNVRVDSARYTRDDLWSEPDVKVVCDPGDHLGWQARFTAGTPLRVLMAFTSALADPAPLLRNRTYLHEKVRARVSATPAFPVTAAAPRSAAAPAPSPALAAAGGTAALIQGSPRDPATQAMTAHEADAGRTHGR